MEATRIIKSIVQTDLPELSSYIGQKVEIIIFPIYEDETLERERIQFFDIIERCAGHIEPWTREELYER